MSLPRFFSRVNDSIGPLLVSGADARDFLNSKSVLLAAPENIEEVPFHVPGFLLLVNLCARLYPEIRVLAPNRVVEESRALALAINPLCTFVNGPGDGSLAGTVAWACSSSVPHAIVVAPLGWEVLVDLPDAQQPGKTNILAALAAAAIAASELFRFVFSDFLPKGRTNSEPGRFNVLTHAPTSATLPELPSDIDIGRVHLVGAGAVGQAAVYALARVSAIGTIVVVDPETISLSNLQRYTLTMDSDVGTSKCALVERAFAKTRRLETVRVESAWDYGLVAAGDAHTICAALDSEDGRIALQASLPRVLYNAWTQPGDIGWSRHEAFGMDPCLACLYWPNRPRPSYHENIAKSIRQPELRVLSYLLSRTPVDQPINPAHIPRLLNQPLPPDAALWSERSLLDDIALSLEVRSESLANWQNALLPELYRDGICGGALVRKQVGSVPMEMAVPLAHQSVLAGIMLATQLLVASHADLRAHRNAAIECRLDMLAGVPQIVGRPRQPTQGCICGDVDFVASYRAKWPARVAADMVK